MFDPIMEQILAIARDAWAFMAGLLLVVALLGGLYFILQGTAGMAFGNFITQFKRARPSGQSVIVSKSKLIGVLNCLLKKHCALNGIARHFRKSGQDAHF